MSEPSLITTPLEEDDRVIHVIAVAAGHIEYEGTDIRPLAITAKGVYRADLDNEDAEVQEVTLVFAHEDLADDLVTGLNLAAPQIALVATANTVQEDTE